MRLKLLSLSLSLSVCLSPRLSPCLSFSVCLSVSPYVCLSVSLTHWSWGSLWTKYRGCQIDSITLDAFLDRTSLNQLRERDRENTFIFFIKISQYTRSKTLTCVSIYRLKRGIESFVYGGAGFKCHLKEISIWVNRRRKLLTTNLKVTRLSIMGSNVWYKNTGTRWYCSSAVIVFTCYQGEVQKDQFDNFPTGYRDIPCGCSVCWEVVGKIRAPKISTPTI